ncbi:MAG: hypothetical protein IC227_01865 [Enterococcus lacertideformus]|uniref:Eps11J n=1 Tax=Enterococcus lacertideformus TaxID=2771493 RepID=A0A931F964_9ENTE|nr:hypothetical protein [Enterococcus lacertideformus]
MEQSLKNKKILFIAWKFYDYPQIITKELEKKGAKVNYYNAVASDSHLKMKISTKLNVLRENYLTQMLTNIANENYDYLFVINPVLFPEKFIMKLTNQLGDIPKLAYLWDSVATFSQVVNYFNYFDALYSFDSKDCKTYSELNFLPLFYVDSGERKKRDERYLFSFVGFGHSMRYSFVNQVKKVCEQEQYNYCFKLYLPSIWHFYYYKYGTKTLASAKRNEFIYKQLPQRKVSEIADHSKIILDLELAHQSGLTMRTIETHGMKRKLITTNPEVKKYDFYHPNNICVVDREEPIIPQQFIESDYQVLNEQLYEKYQLTRWLDRIFSGKR